MATLKLKHLILFAICLMLFISTNFPGGALLSLFAWMQLCLLLWRQDFTARNQIKFSILFLSLVPTYFLWGAVNSFVFIYAQSSHLIFILMYGLLSFIVCFWITLFSVFSFAYAKNNDTLLEVYSKCLSHIKSEKYVFLYVSAIVFLISISSIPVAEDYKIVLGIITAHVFLRSQEIKALISV
jgi:hypothetical protein